MPPDPALLDRTLASIRSNFESLRRFDPIPALMAESPTGQREEFGSGKSPVPSVPAWNHSACRWLGSSSILEGGKPVAGRDLWVAGKDLPIDRLKLAAEAAAGFAVVLRESVGIPKLPRAGDPWNRWFWTVFEVAAAEPPYSVLRLKGGGVFRTAVGGVVRASVSELEGFKKHGLPPDEIVGALILSQDYSPVLYWELKDFVEASLWALDLVAVALPAVIDRERGPDKALAGDRPGEPAEESKSRGPTTEQRLQALYLNPEKLDFVLEASEKELAKEIGRESGAFSNCDFFQETLKPLRAKRRAEIRAGKRRVKGAQKWGHFDSTAARDVDADENH